MNHMTDLTVLSHISNRLTVTIQFRRATKGHGKHAMAVGHPGYPGDSGACLHTPGRARWM